MSESSLWLVYPVAFLSAALSQFSGPAENAFLPRLYSQAVVRTAPDTSPLLAA